MDKLERITTDPARMNGEPAATAHRRTTCSKRRHQRFDASMGCADRAKINASLPTAKRQRFLTPLLYQNGAAGVGYDAVTGWGVPDGAALLSVL
jgi:hypothetical protein